MRTKKGKYEKWLEPENLVLIQGWRRDGLDLKQIAQNMGIHVGTLCAWVNKYSEIREALKAGTEVTVYNTENELYESSRNRYVEEIEVVETAIYNKETGEKLEIVNRTTKKHRKFVPGNVAAQIFILKNRAANKWRERPDLIEQSEVTDDGFVEAMKASVDEVWTDEEDNPSV